MRCSINKRMQPRIGMRRKSKKYLNEDKRRNLPDEEKPPRYVGLTPIEQGRLKVRKQDDWIWTRRLERYQPLSQSVYNGQVPKSLNSKKMRMPRNPSDLPIPSGHILMGGNIRGTRRSSPPWRTQCACVAIFRKSRQSLSCS